MVGVDYTPALQSPQWKREQQQQQQREGSVKTPALCANFASNDAKRRHSNAPPPEEKKFFLALNAAACRLRDGSSKSADDDCSCFLSDTSQTCAGHCYQVCACFFFLERVKFQHK